jgi:hypothetical protein
MGVLFRKKRAKGLQVTVGTGYSEAEQLAMDSAIPL